MNRLGTSPESDLTEVTEFFLRSFCEKEVADTACWRKRLFSFGVAMTTTSSMSMTLVVSFGITCSVSAGEAAATVAATATSGVNTVRLFIIFSFKNVFK